MLLGMLRKSNICKICSSFEDDVINQITLDLLLQRKTWQEIKSFYSPQLPRGIHPLNDVNLNSHKNHCDPKLLAESYLRDKGVPVSAGENYMLLFSKKFLEEIDRKRLLTEIYKKRIQNLETLQNLLNIKLIELNTLPSQPPDNAIAEEIKDFFDKKELLVKDIRSLTDQIDGVMNDIQSVVVRELGNEKSVVQAQQTVNITFINNVQNSMQNFLQELVPYILTDAFKDDQNAGRKFLAFLSGMMDKHIMPVIENPKQITESVIK